jgi:DNA mismatch repair protein MutS
MTHPIMEKIKNLNIEEMTPISALNFLWELKKEVLEKEKREK